MREEVVYVGRKHELLCDLLLRLTDIGSVRKSRLMLEVDSRFEWCLIKLLVR